MDIIGQRHARRYLAEGLERKRLSPSLLFVGPEGVGKRTIALELAKCFSCESLAPFSADALPRCGACRSCARVESGNHSDVLVIDRDLQATILKEKRESQTAIKIEAIRYADKFLSLKPVESARRMVIIDEAHKMTVDAANALLKTLEEPPNNAQLVLVATDAHSLPSTIRSRCGVLMFRPLSLAEVASWLERTKSYDSEKARRAAELSGGSLAKAAAVEDEAVESVDLSGYNLEEFLEMLSDGKWRKDARKQGEAAITQLIESARRRMEGGDLSQRATLEALLAARRQIDRHVPPKLVLENLYLTLQKS